MTATKLQGDLITMLVKMYTQIIGKDIINWEMPAKDESGNVCLIMILKWRTDKDNKMVAKPAPGWTMYTLISPEGEVLGQQTK